MSYATNKKPRVVAYVINDLLMGGAQSLVVSLAENIDRTRFLPHIYYLNEYPPERTNLKERLASNGVEFTYIGAGRKTTIWSATSRLQKQFRKNRPDIVHTHLIDATLSGVIAARLVGCSAIVIHEHQTHSLYSWKIRLAYRLLRPFTSLTLCFSPIIEKELFGSVAVLNEKPSLITRKSYTIYNGVDVAKIEAVQEKVDRTAKRKELGLPEDAFVITSIARLISWKGQQTLLEAFGRIAHSIPSAHLCLVGEGPLKESLVARAIELGVANRVHLFGARNDVYEILRTSDVGSLALTYEGTMQGESIGIAGYEIMGMGLPFIASAYPSAALTVVDGHNAILVPPKDVEALASALERLYKEPALRAMLGKNAAAYIHSTMNWKILVPLYEELYELLP